MNYSMAKAIFLYKNPKDVDGFLLFQRPNIVLPVVRLVCRSTLSGRMQLFSLGFLPSTHERTRLLDMCWSDRKWALAPRSGSSA